MRFPAVFLLALLTAAFPASADIYIISFDKSVREQSATGRIMLFFITESGRYWDRQRPIDGPFFEKPQPIASIGVSDLQPGQEARIDTSIFSFPQPLSELQGTVRVQAILDLHDNPERSHTDGPENLFSDVMTFELSRDRDDVHRIKLNNVIEPLTLPVDEENLRWIEMRSEILSSVYGRDVFHRAGVALPPGHADASHPRQTWPAIYVIPGYGGRHEAARMYAAMFQRPSVADTGPMAVYIVLDPESPLGHHGFTDSPNHGPRGTALTREFIPYLEERFRLVATPEARIVTGHSSGGWTSLWLQLNWPEVFGACFSSAPDPIDFTAFQMSNIYKDESMYVMADSSDTPSYRQAAGAEDRVAMTVRQECLMEFAMHPLGGSGQQWDAWMAMFSPRDPETGFPKRLFDPRTGVIDRDVAGAWQQFDMARMVNENWDHFGPIVTQRVRLVCGKRDNYYLQRAVQQFKEMIEQRGEHDGPGYIFLHEQADHSSIIRFTFQRWNREMREHLRNHDLQD